MDWNFSNQFIGLRPEIPRALGQNKYAMKSNQ